MCACSVSRAQLHSTLFRMHFVKFGRREGVAWRAENQARTIYLRAGRNSNTQPSIRSRSGFTSTGGDSRVAALLDSAEDKGSTAVDKSDPLPLRWCLAVREVRMPRE